MSDSKGIYGAIADILAEIGPIAKGREATEGTKYRYRSVDDVYNAVHPLLVKHGVFCRSEIVKVESEVKERIYNEQPTGKYVTIIMLTARYYFCHRDGSELATEVVAEGRDFSDKAAGKAMSYAHKYAICQMFSIPFQGMPDTDHNGDLDPDADVIAKALEQITKAKTAERLDFLQQFAQGALDQGRIRNESCDLIVTAITNRRSVINAIGG